MCGIASATGKFFHYFRSSHGFHHGFHRHDSHFGRPFSFGTPRHHRFDQHFGLKRNPKSFHTPFQPRHFSPHMWRRA
jgi:hypothetical protein